MTAAGPGRPRRLAGQHRAQLGHPSRVTQARLDRAGQLAAVRRLLPLVAEQRARGHRADRRLRLARAVGAEHVQVQPGAQVADVDHDLGARGDAADDSQRDRLLAGADCPAELVGERVGGRLGAGSKHTPGP